MCGVELALSHVGSKFVVVRESQNSFAAGEAQLLISVDGIEDKKTVVIPNGIPAGTSVRVDYF